MLLCALAAACSSSTKPTSVPVAPTTTTGIATVAQSVFNTYLDAFNQGDVDGALAALAPKAVLSSPQCGDTPCVGVAAIRPKLAAAAAAHTRLAVSDVTVVGSTVRGNFTMTEDNMPPGVTRGKGAFAAAVTDGKISYLTIDYDHHDPETEKLLG